MGRRTRRLAVLILAAALAPSVPAQDLDAFMAEVLARRDENWKKLQQYVLEERETLQVIGPDGGRIHGFAHDYTWFIRDGYFVRSPLVFDGVRVSDTDRTAYEQRWIAREQRREAERRRANTGTDAAAAPKEEPITPAGAAPAAVSGAVEPRFVSAAYFLRFKFDPGHYAFVGRETWRGREVLKIEYYPSKLFTEGRTRANRRARERDDLIEEKMNKVSLVTLWIEPTQHQIVQYTFDNVDPDFLPGRSLVRVDELHASMEMTEAFPAVWLPATIAMRFGLLTALGPLAARYDVRYHDHRLAEVTTRVRPPER